MQRTFFALVSIFVLFLVVAPGTVTGETDSNDVADAVVVTTDEAVPTTSTSEVCVTDRQDTVFASLGGDPFCPPPGGCFDDEDCDDACLLWGCGSSGSCSPEGYCSCSGGGPV